MDLTFPFEEPIDVAKFLRLQDLKKQITLLKKMATIGSPDNEFFARCLICYEKFVAGKEEQAVWWSQHALIVKPSWLTSGRCKEYREELRQKHPVTYDYTKPRKAKKA